MNSSTSPPEIEKGVAEYENAIRETDIFALGFGLYNIKLIILCGISMLATAVELLCMAYVIPAAHCDLNLTLSDKTVISSIGFLGVAISCVFWGILADSIGRKKVIVVTMFLSFLFGIASSLVNQIWLFILLRFFNGFFIACPTAIIFPYVGECHSDQHRSKAISWIGSFIAFSYIYLPCISWLILRMKWSFKISMLDLNLKPWRLLVFLISFPSFVLCVCFHNYPESPKYLWSIGKSEECLEILRDMYEMNTKKERASYPVKAFVIDKKPEELNDLQNSSKSITNHIIMFFKSVRDGMIPLFIMPLLPKTILTSLMQFGILVSGLGVGIWFPEIVNKVQFYVEAFPSKPATICEAIDYGRNLERIKVSTNTKELDCSDGVDENVFIITIIYGVLATSIFTLLGFVINKIGKKMVLVIILFVTGLSGIIASFMTEYYLMMVFLITYLLCGMGCNTAFAIQVELFPTEHRGKSLAFAQMMGRCGSLIGSVLTGILFKVWCPLIFYLFATLLLALILNALLLPIPLFVCKKTTTIE